MSNEYWQQYYKQNKHRIKQKKQLWRLNNPEKAKEYYYKDLPLSRERSRRNFRKWISNPVNRQHKKQYQKVWFQNKYRFIKEDNREIKYLEQIFVNNTAIINGYEIFIKQDKGFKWFYYIVQNGKSIYISDKFETKKDLIKDLQYAI